MAAQMATPRNLNDDSARRSDKLLEPPMVFDNVPLVKGSRVFALAAECKADPNPSKLNLTVGAFRDDLGNPYVMNIVKETEEQIGHAVAQGTINHEYPPMGGSQDLVNATASLILGKNSSRIAKNQVRGIQTISGTGALRMAADFLGQFNTNSNICAISDPTWENHRAIFKRGGMAVQTYTYYDDSSCGLDIHGLLRDLSSLKPHSVVVLHACAHNPTGVDPTAEDWSAIADVCQQNQLVPVFDCAYLGFVSGNPDKDAFAVRMFAKRNLNFFMCVSFSKNFGLYDERCGVLLFCGPSEKVANSVQSQLNIISRATWSVPPMHGCRIVQSILLDEEKHQKWRRELQSQADRILEMRNQLYDHLHALMPARDWTHVRNQCGMFTYTGLNREQCEAMRREHHVYLLDTGRINVSGIPAARVEYLAQSIFAVCRPDETAESANESDTSADAISVTSCEVDP